MSKKSIIEELEKADVEEELAKAYKTVKMPNLPKPLSLNEKKYLLAVERGDTSTTKTILQNALMKKDQNEPLNINCMDPMGRGALLMAIEAEDLPMVELLLVMGVETKDGLLHAIEQEFVEAVELLLEHEELVHKTGSEYSWEKVDRNIASFTPEITPLILAAHKNNYEILKLLFDRGATVPMPHDIRCGCEDCVRSSHRDSLRHSMSRISAYKALASSSLIALSSTDPILTAFELSYELENMAEDEPEFGTEYMELKTQCQQFAVELLSHSRTSQELAIILNHDPDEPPPVEMEDYMSLTRLELAIHYQQKEFVAHPNVQQLLAALWYDGLPGFRRKSLIGRLLDIVWVAIMFPFYSMLYIVAPNSETGQLMRKPFMKFLIHANSYLFFLFLLILMSQRIETVVMELIGTQWMLDSLEEARLRQRGNWPTVTEVIVMAYIIGFIWEEFKDIWQNGFDEYMQDMWNIIDWCRNCLYISWIGVKMYALFTERAQIATDPSSAFIPREEWDAYDPQLVAEGLCSAANVFSALKLVHMFSINPHLGPLQISLGRMIIDIIQFFFIYSLVLFAFACGLNQLLWYYADLEEAKCFSLPGGLPDWNKSSDQCYRWRRFANVFESCQSLFWASFGMIGLEVFELAGIQEYTRFMALLMFGSYSCINVVVLLNLLIAMMSNSFSVICERSDTEWKFARTKLWLQYFESGATVPPPFNIIPTVKGCLKTLGIREKDRKRKMSTKRREKHEKERDFRYVAVIRALVWRYITKEHREGETRYITEDDINEVKNDISAFRHELLNIFKHNGIEVDQYTTKKHKEARKARQWERRLMKNFHVNPVSNEDLDESKVPEQEEALERFKRVARLSIGKLPNQQWDDILGDDKGSEVSQIGRATSTPDTKHRQSLKKAIQEIQQAIEENRTPCWSPASSAESSPSKELSRPSAVVSLQLLKLFQKTKIKRRSLELISERSESTTPEPGSNSLAPPSSLKEARKMQIDNEERKKELIGSLIKKKRESQRRKDLCRASSDLIRFEDETMAPEKPKIAKDSKQSSSSNGTGNGTNGNQAGINGDTIPEIKTFPPQVTFTPSSEQSTPTLSGSCESRKSQPQEEAVTPTDTSTSEQPPESSPPETTRTPTPPQKARTPTPPQHTGTPPPQHVRPPTPQQHTRIQTPPQESKSPPQQRSPTPQQPARTATPPQHAIPRPNVSINKRPSYPILMQEASVIPQGVVGKAHEIFGNVPPVKQEVPIPRRISRPTVCSPVPEKLVQSVTPRNSLAEPPPPGIEKPFSLQKRAAPPPPVVKRPSLPIEPTDTVPPAASPTVGAPLPNQDLVTDLSEETVSSSSPPKQESEKTPPGSTTVSPAPCSPEKEPICGASEDSAQEPAESQSAFGKDEEETKLIIKTVKSPTPAFTKSSTLSSTPSPEATPVPESPVPSAGEPSPETLRRAQSIDNVELEKVKKTSWF